MERDPQLDQVLADAWYGSRSARLLESYKRELADLEMAVAAAHSAVVSLLRDPAVDKTGFAESDADDFIWRAIVSAHSDVQQIKARVHQWHAANRKGGAV